MKVDKKLIERVSHVARLNLKSKEAEELIPDFKEILKLFSKIDKVMIDEKLDLKEGKDLREDKVEPCLDEKEVFCNSRSEEDGYFKGPKIK